MVAIYCNTFKEIYRSRVLLFALSLRDIEARYKGSTIGVLWNVLSPLLMLVVYSFVFGIVFKAKWGVETEANFAVILFCGLIVHSFLAEVVNLSPQLMQGNANYVKKTVFPLEILPVKVVLVSLFNHIVSLLILLIFISFSLGEILLTWIYYPLVMGAMVLLLLALSFLISALGAYLKDLSYISGLATTLLLFLSPIFYPLSAIPEIYQPFILLNPLTFIIEQLRSVLIYGVAPDFLGLAIYYTAGLVVLYLSVALFNRVRVGFSDVL